jgi:hypothetical protein
MLKIEPVSPADLPVIERFIAALYDVERHLDPRLSPGIELAADGLKRMLNVVALDSPAAVVYIIPSVQSQG